jgi:phage RecT family recombinase
MTMNAVATVPQPAKSKITEFLDRVFVADRVTKMSLPDSIDPEKFRANLYTAIATNPKLLNCNPNALFIEVAGAASLGLRFDPLLGEAYLIAVRDEPQLRVGYRGLIKLARQSGEVVQCYAHTVYQKDRFDVALGLDTRLVHVPNLDEDERGPARLFYAVAKFKDGEADFEVMGLKAIYAIRERSDGYRAFKNGRIKSTPWDSDFEEMARKTVIRRLLKRIPKSPDVSRLLDRDRELEDAPYQDVTPGPRRQALRTIAAPPPPAAEQPGEEEVPNQRGGEVDLGALVAEYEECALVAQTVDDLAECEHQLAGVMGDLSDELRARVDKASLVARARLSPPSEKPKPQTRKATAPPPPADPAPEEGVGLLDQLRAKAKHGRKALRLALGGLTEFDARLLTEDDRQALEQVAAQADESN